MTVAVKQLKALEILDSRGNPTVEAVVILENGVKGVGKVPSGASTGSREALELRDGGERYFGKGVRKAIENIENSIAPKLQGKTITDQQEIDQIMLDLDGSPNKSKLGANALLAVSIAVADAAAKVSEQPLYHYLNQLFVTEKQKEYILPVPMMNIINGGAHADNNLDFQEFMIVPHGAPSFAESVRYGVEVFHCLKKILHQNKLVTSVGDEGGFAPNLSSHRAALDIILEAVTQTGLSPGKDVSLALDVASSEFHQDGRYVLASEKKELSNEQMIDYLADWVENYPIISIEDGLAEDDWQGWQAATERLGDKIQIVGDDLFVTNSKILKTGIEQGIANSILIKINQIGTLTETMEAMHIAQKADYNCVVSHRSGETEDSTIADLAVATNAQQIKTGSLCRSDRVAKYNQLLRIETDLGQKALFAGNRPYQRYL